MEGANDDQYSLKWNNFQNNLATGFHDLLQEEMMLDVTLAMEGKYLQAHKIVLSVCSPYFKDLFKANPCKHPIIILKDVSHQHMSDMLEFMYLGEANVRQDDLSGFLKLAETLKVKGLAGDKANENDTPQQMRKQAQQAPKKKKMTDASIVEADDHDPGDTDFNPGGGEPRRKRRRSSPPPKTDSVMSSNSTSAVTIPLANPKQEIPDEDVELLDAQEDGDTLSQLLDNAPKQEHEHQEFDDSNFDNTLDDTGDGAQENDFDMSAGPSNPDETTDQVPQGMSDIILKKTKKGGPMLGWKGFNYSIVTKSLNKVTWRCIKYYHGCRALAYVTRDGQVSFRGGHSHLVEEDYNNAPSAATTPEPSLVRRPQPIIRKTGSKKNARLPVGKIKGQGRWPLVSMGNRAEGTPAKILQPASDISTTPQINLEKSPVVVLEKNPQLVVKKCTQAASGSTSPPVSTDTSSVDQEVTPRNTVGNRKRRKRLFYKGHWYVKQRFNARSSCFQWACVRAKCYVKCLVSDSGIIDLRGTHTCGS